MSRARLRKRVPGARSLGCYILACYDLRFHKVGQDKSAKCDAFFTNKTDDIVYGVLYEINPKEKPALDRAEGLSNGYNEKIVKVKSLDGTIIVATMYIATNIDEKLEPFHWYLNHVLKGARENSLPPSYIEEKITSVTGIADPNKARSDFEMNIHNV